MPLPAGRGSFLIGADLNAPDGTTKISRRKRHKLDKASRAERTNRELDAEKRPRTETQQRWLEEERKRTKLPTPGAAPKVAESLSSLETKQFQKDEGMGRKKLKRMADLQRKQSQKAAKKAAALQKDHRQAAEALQGKIPKKGGAALSPAATELLKRVSRDTKSEQRLLAMVAEKVSADPNKELELFDVFFELHASGAEFRTRQLALLSAVAVFKDLVPGYRIREPTEVEKAMTRSKGVLTMEKYELSLLAKYRRLLPAVEAAMKQYPKVVAPALAALVKAASEFNYQQRLITTAVKYASSENEDVRRTLSLALQEMVEVDQKLDASKEVVLAIGNLAQAAAAGKGGRPLKTDLLLVLLRLPIGRAEAAELKEDKSAAELDDDVRRGMAEGMISHTAEYLRKAEATLLYEVFCVYLRILRQRGVHSREVISAAMVGLAKWGREVNLELLLEILSELRHVVRDAIGQTDELVSLQGLNCALVLLSGPSQALITDATWLADSFTQALSLALPSLHSVHSESPSWPPERVFTMEDGGMLLSKREMDATLEAESVPHLVLQCLGNAMRCPHGFGRASDSALASLLETLFLLAASADSHVALALLKEAAAILKRNHRLHTLLDVDGGLFGLGGITDRAVSVVWQLLPLTHSLAPWPAKVGKGLVATVRSRRALLADLFPSRDSRAWMEGEFPQHVAALLEAPVPPGLERDAGQRPAQSRKAAASARAKASFCSETDLRTMLGVPLESS